MSGPEDIIDGSAKLSGELQSWLLRQYPHTWEKIFKDASGRFKAALSFKYKPAASAKTSAESWTVLVAQIPVKGKHFV